MAGDLIPVPGGIGSALKKAGYPTGATEISFLMWVDSVEKLSSYYFAMN